MRRKIIYDVSSFWKPLTLPDNLLRRPGGNLGCGMGLLEEKEQIIRNLLLHSSAGFEACSFSGHLETRNLRPICQ